MLVAAVYLFNILDGTAAVCAQCGNQQGYPARISGLLMVMPLQVLFPAQSDDCCAVGITKDDACAHIYEFVYKEQAAFKHLLVNEYAALCLRGYYQYNTDQVGRKARPGMIVHCKYRTVQERFGSHTSPGRVHEYHLR